MTGSSPRHPRFGALVTNLLADEDSPRRRGYFVRVARHTRGRGFAPGTYWQLTDGAGEFWEIHPTRGELGHPGRGPVVEVDESCGLDPIKGLEVRP